MELEPSLFLWILTARCSGLVRGWVGKGKGQREEGTRGLMEIWWWLFNDRKNGLNKGDTERSGAVNGGNQ